MNQVLQEAIAATRANDKRKAQLLLATNLKENPEDVQSWYLLSMLVDSKEKQALYLGKALALDPTHPKAQERLTRLQTAETIAISAEPLDFLAQSEGETLPEWLAGDAGALQLENMGMRAAPVAEEESKNEAGVTAVVTPAKDVPEWLQQDVNPAWVTQEPPTQVSPAPAEKKVAPKPKPQPAPAAKAKPAPRKKAPAKKKPRTKKQKASQLNLVMGILVIFFILVVLLLLYLAF